MAPVSTTAENSANTENYEHAQSTIDKVLEKVASLKETEANAEIKRQFENLDEAYENAIRLRMLRINTLQAHCDDRDAEIVALRKQSARLEQAKMYATIAATVALFISLLFALYCFLPHATIAAMHAANHYARGVAIIIIETSWGAALASCIATLIMLRFFRL